MIATLFYTACARVATRPPVAGHRPRNPVDLCRTVDVRGGALIVNTIWAASCALWTYPRPLSEAPRCTLSAGAGCGGRHGYIRWVARKTDPSKPLNVRGSGATCGPRRSTRRVSNVRVHDARHGLDAASRCRLGTSGSSSVSASGHRGPVRSICPGADRHHIEGLVEAICAEASERNPPATCSSRGKGPASQLMF
jgi:hypothetical protein